MYTLYGADQTGTCAVQAALEELGAPYRMIEVATGRGEHLTEAYRAINPRQQVPSLALPDGSIVTEGPAILLHLADSHPEARLAPEPGTVLRAQHDRWLIFFAVNVYEGELRKAFPVRYTTDAAGAGAVRDAASAYVERHYAIFESAGGVEFAPFTFGPQLTVLDIYVWMLSQWLDPGLLEARFPKVAALAGAVRRRPRIAPVHQANFGMPVHG